MRLAIVHYHLRRGGVTRVVGNALESLGEAGIRPALLASDAPGLDPAWDRLVERIPGLGYESGESPRSLEEALRQGARRRLGGPPDLWHVHNPHLGKNAALTAAVASLARSGERLLLHIHDFPEDGRPGSYQGLLRGLGGREGLARLLYPVGETIRYAVLNRRDRDILAGAGLPRQWVRVVPNPVSPVRAEGEGRPDLPGDSLILYPTRAIRRKNLGEFLLWASLASPGELYGCSLAPENPRALAVYRRWVERAQRWSLPVRFDLGSAHPFGQLAAAADRWATTSVAEGFGLAFLEPWLAGKCVVGRDLPGITSDFSQEGLDLSHLYRRLDVPLSWLDRDRLRAALEQSLGRVHRAYSMPLDPGAAGIAWESMARQGRIDFGRLGEPFQEEIVDGLCGGRLGGSGIRPSRLASPLPEARIGENRRAVQRSFSAKSHARELGEIYRQLLEAEPGPVHWLDPDRVLARFLDPARHSFLRDD